MQEVATDIKAEAVIALSARSGDGVTNFAITLNIMDGEKIVKSKFADRGGETKVPGGPSLRSTKANIFELRTEPRVLSTVVEKLDETGHVKVTIKALIVAKEYEDKEYDPWTQDRFRVIRFDEIPRDIALRVDYQMIAAPLSNDDVEVEIIYNDVIL